MAAWPGSTSLRMRRSMRAEMLRSIWFNRF
jgi:hypothetical protein